MYLSLPISKSLGEKESVFISTSPPDITNGLPLFSPPNLLPKTSAICSASSLVIDKSFFGDITTLGTPVFFTNAAPICEAAASPNTSTITDLSGANPLL